MVFKPNYSSARVERERKKAAKKAAKIEARKKIKDGPDEIPKNAMDAPVFEANLREEE